MKQCAKGISFDLFRASVTLLISLSVYAWFCVIAITIAPRQGDFDTLPLYTVHAGGALALLTFWRMGRWGRARFDCFGALLLLVGAALRFHAILDMIFFGARTDDLYALGTVPVPDNLFWLYVKSEFITVIGLLLVACSWRIVAGRRVESMSLSANNRSVPTKLPIMIYAAAIGVDVLQKIAGEDFGSFRQLGSLLFAFGVASIYFVASNSKARTRKFLTSVGMGLPMVALAMGGGMKEAMFFPLIPAVVIFWQNYKNVPIRSVMIAVVFVGFSVSQMYVYYVRATTWRGVSSINLPVPVLVNGFIDTFPSIRWDDAFDSSSSRMNMTNAHAITTTLADRLGFEPKNVFGVIPESLIPRILWPGKPILEPGAMHTARIHGLNESLDQIRTATAAGFSTELYLGGWWFGVFLGGCIYGGLLASAQRYSESHWPGFPHFAFCFIVAYWTIRFDEIHIGYAYTSILFVFVFLYFIHVLSGFIENSTMLTSNAKTMDRRSL